MCDISPPQTLLILISLIPNNNIRYTVLGLCASIAALYGIHFQRPSVRLHHLENNVSHTKDIIHEAKSLCPRDHLSLMESEIPGMGWTLAGIKNYRQFFQDIHQCKKEAKRIRVALTVESERRRKYMEDIRETLAIVTAARDPRGQVAPYNYSGGAVPFHHHASESYRSVLHPRLWSLF
ncbi:hypothetical protein C8R44DRAFT_863491 [Mycena epipterygia]|nr:hypothetical protein C8R44DRAFT_863491 [Mycena epipterygia]